MSENLKHVTTLADLSREAHKSEADAALERMLGSTDSKKLRRYRIGKMLRSLAFDHFEEAKAYNADASPLAKEARPIRDEMALRYPDTEAGAMELEEAYALDGFKKGAHVEAVYRRIYDQACVQVEAKHPEIVQSYPGISGNLVVALLAKAKAEGDYARKAMRIGNKALESVGLGKLAEKRPVTA
jgi:hypothetical protein